MFTEFKLPELGENITSGIAVKISVSIGDTVEPEQTLIELETDKATIEVPSPQKGIIKDILIREGEEVHVGQVIVKIETSPVTGRSSTEEQVTSEIPGDERQTTGDATDAPGDERRATGDVTDVTDAPGDERRATGDVTDVAAAPSVRRFAREIGIEITHIPGSGPGGRISKTDVKAYAKQFHTKYAQRSHTKAMPKPGVAGDVPPPLPDFSKWGVIERKPMSNIRRTTAEHLSVAWSNIPYVTQFDKADITDLEDLRKKFSKPDLKLTITPFIMKVVASALKSFPQFNASVDMDAKEIIYKKYVHVGVAVDTENGLLVPVIRDVNKKSILHLAQELARIAERARNKKLSLEEMKGGSITITNLGGIGGSFFTPIINYPEVAVLGISRSKMEPDYGQGTCTPRLMLPFSLSYDHRVIDGADGARFLRWVCDAIQQPFMLELEN